MNELCSAEEMDALVQRMGSANSDDSVNLAEIDRLLERYRDDARLHFLRGSLLAGQQKAVDAHAALARAVDLAPDFAIARYQLGFFELTSGEVDRALSVWGPLMRLPADAYLRVFAESLTHLVRDEFDEALAGMQRGIALNQESEPLNGDIRLLMAECEKLRDGSGKNGAAPAGDNGASSATSVLLGQFRG